MFVTRCIEDSCPTSTFNILINNLINYRTLQLPKYHMKIAMQQKERKSVNLPLYLYSKTQRT
jgi:hypothetical protein